MPRIYDADLPPDIDPDALQQAIESRFQCQRCGNCCKGDGLVRIKAPEADRLSVALGMSRADFLRQYAIRTSSGRWRLKDQWVKPEQPNLPSEQWCIFLERDAAGLYGCRVNAAKPDQCASFPARWRNDDSLQSCAGMQKLLAQLSLDEKPQES